MPENPITHPLTNNKDVNPLHILREDLTTLSPSSRKIATLYFQANHLKHIYRKGWLEHGIQESVTESVADHSFGVAFLALILANDVDPSLNQEKLLKMALLHDYSESVIGDTTPRNEVDQTFHQIRRSNLPLHFVFPDVDCISSSDARL